MDYVDLQNSLNDIQEEVGVGEVWGCKTKQSEIGRFKKTMKYNYYIIGTL